MADIDVASSIEVPWGTGTHYDETLATRGGEVPGQMMWRDIHPAGVVVLPKGSPPAGPGQVNWENTLGGQFALALARLEGLLYALYGSRPAAYPNGSGGWNKCHWWDRLNPRCLWAAEVWKPRCLSGGTGCTSSGFCNGNCYDFEQIGEYAALGDTGGMGYPTPAVPIRPRSENPALQFLAGQHDRTVFPVGSVTREHAAFPHSPQGRGWFGATQPGRNDSPAWLTEANGYTRNLGQSVKVTWTKPDGVTVPTLVQLVYQLRPPGGSWGSETIAVMTPTDDVYEATIAEQDHGTECRWFIRYLYDDTSPANADVERFEPGNLTEPDAGDRYTFTWFTHFNPFERGLPELLDNYGGVDIRHGTDGYQFDGSESIQPELINLARWTISAICGTTCIFSDTQCDDGLVDGHPGQLHHNPRLRGSDHAQCCAPRPIRFYWSGSNVYPHYLRGGKGDGTNPLDTRPLHNLGDVAVLGNMAARMSWAGIENLFGDTLLANPEYGGGASYSVPPFQQKLWYDGSGDAEIKATWTRTGLGEGHVIEAVHIQEIIDAVDYLVRYGCWITDLIKSCKTKADGFAGHPCGYVHHTYQTGPETRNPNFDCRWECVGSGTRTVTAPMNNCCGPTSFNWGLMCEPYILTSTFRAVDEGAGCIVVTSSFDQNTIGGAHCDDWDTPTWEECWNQESPCEPGKCKMDARKWKDCKSAPNSNYGCHGTVEGVCVSCGSPTADCLTTPTFFCGNASPDGCGYYTCSQTCEWYDGFADQVIPCTSRNSLNSASPGCGASARVGVSGLTYRYCSGPQCRGGWDDSHGNALRKHRFDHVWHPSLQEVATGPPGFEASGNCYGDIVVCGNLETGTYPTSWFQEVRKVTFEGAARTWYTEDCWCSDTTGCPSVPALGDPPPLPGIGLHTADGTPLCERRRRVSSGTSRFNDTQCECTLGDWGPCNGDQAWVAINLNLDGTGTPYANYSGRSLSGSAYTGDCIPTLIDYDMTKDPATYMHDCPCETWTGAAECEVG